MAIVSGVNIPDNKRVETALTSVYGIGPFQAKSILEKAGVFDNPRVRDMEDSKQQLHRLVQVFRLVMDFS